MSEQRIMDGEWRLLEDDPVTGHAKWFLQLDENRFVIKDVYYQTDALLDANAARLNDSLGKRWGDGQIAASIPLNVFFDKLAEPLRQKDRGYIKRFLNDADNAKFRTFRGRV
jgi:hypothetical protein